jgi:predicted RNA-binding protein with RPS1 domain
MDLEVLRQYGQRIVDEVESGPYSMILVVSQSGEYQVGLTSFQQNFTKPEHQQDKQSSPKEKKEIKQNFKKMVDKLTEWINKYGRITIGSFNLRKIKKYYSLLKSVGFNCEGLVLTSYWGKFTVSQKLPS